MSESGAEAADWRHRRERAEAHPRPMTAPAEVSPGLRPAWPRSAGPGARRQVERDERFQAGTAALRQAAWAERPRVEKRRAAWGERPQAGTGAQRRAARGGRPRVEQRRAARGGRLQAGTGAPRQAELSRGHRVALGARPRVERAARRRSEPVLPHRPAAARRLRLAGPASAPRASGLVAPRASPRPAGRLRASALARLAGQAARESRASRALWPRGSRREREGRVVCAEAALTLCRFSPWQSVKRGGCQRIPAGIRRPRGRRVGCPCGLPRWPGCPPRTGRTTG